MTIGRAHIQERLHQGFGIAAELRERHATLQNRANELDHIVTVQGIAAGQEQARAGAGAGASPVFDALELDQYSELHGTVHGFVETVADLQALQSRLLDTLSALDTAVTQEQPGQQRAARTRHARAHGAGSGDRAAAGAHRSPGVRRHRQARRTALRRRRRDARRPRRQRPDQPPQPPAAQCRRPWPRGTGAARGTPASPKAG
ncbi:MAG: hypothetical protein MZV65_30960 [Chromatiales bacterium]|nr:hypothetical protein [Chromatiales bacterium]